MQLCRVQSVDRHLGLDEPSKFETEHLLGMPLRRSRLLLDPVFQAFDRPVPAGRDHVEVGARVFQALAVRHVKVLRCNSSVAPRFSGFSRVEPGYRYQRLPLPAMPGGAAGHWRADVRFGSGQTADDAQCAAPRKRLRSRFRRVVRCHGGLLGTGAGRNVFVAHRCLRGDGFTSRLCNDGGTRLVGVQRRSL